MPREMQREPGLFKCPQCGAVLMEEFTHGSRKQSILCGNCKYVVRSNEIEKELVRFRSRMGDQGGVRWEEEEVGHWVYIPQENVELTATKIIIASDGNKKEGLGYSYLFTYHNKMLDTGRTESLSGAKQQAENSYMQWLKERCEKA